MALQARVIGPESDLGVFSKLNFFGNEIDRDWTDVTLTKEQIEKANGNRYIELKGHKAPKPGNAEAEAAQAAREAEDEAEAETIRARLTELGVEPGNANLAALRTKLDKAEKAEAKRLEEEEDLRRKLAESEAQ